MSMKDSQFSEPIRPVPRSGRDRSWLRRTFRVLLAAATVILIWSWMTDDVLRSDFLGGGTGIPDDDPAPQQSTNGFRGIKSSVTLNWVPCYRSEGPFFCARLTVPMDYHRPLEDSVDHPTVELALLLQPGEGRATYGQDNHISPSNFSVSPLLINPGGPGGSGVHTVKTYGARLQSIVGKDRDIIGFDPRGVGSSTPRSDCFLQTTRPAGGGGAPEPANERDALMRRMLFMVGEHDIGIVNSSDVALAKTDAQNRAVNMLCDAKDLEETDRNILRYAGTPNVARDMLSIVHAWDAWQGIDTTTSDSGIMMNDGKKRGTSFDTRGKLVYWGLSYGTLLGATFSAMFPDKVGRVILDGVCDADHYVSPTWYDSLMDTDTIWDHFFVYCHEAKSKCAFYHPSYSVQDLRDRYQAIEDGIRANPIIVITAEKLPVLVTFSDIKGFIFSALYQPMVFFPYLARILVWLEAAGEQEGKGAAPFFPVASLPAAQGGCLAEPEMYPDDTLRAVMCGDKRYPLNQTVPELQDRFERMARLSNFADVWMTVMLFCSHYDIPVSDPPMRWGKKPEDVGEVLFGGGRKPSVQRFRGEDIHRAEMGGESVATMMASERKIKTNFPILLMSNTYDPVTPKAAAMKMTQKFEGARFLEQKAFGHCTLSATSLCTLVNARNYIREGILPEESDIGGGKWTVCEADGRPWFPDGDEGAASTSEGDKEEDDQVSELSIEMLEGWAELQKGLAKDRDMPRYGLPRLSRGGEILLRMFDIED